jgi:hypothetical protein
MSEAKFTSGPWQWYWREEDGEVNCGVFYEERPGIAWSICRAPRYETQEQWAANARLISAAPEHHEASLSTVERLADLPRFLREENNSALAEIVEEELAKHRAAIAKATGQ